MIAVMILENARLYKEKWERILVLWVIVRYALNVTNQSLPFEFYLHHAYGYERGMGMVIPFYLLLVENFLSLIPK